MFQSKQTQQLVRIQPQPLPTSLDEWHGYWQAKGFPWRTKPEIDEKRQKELSQRRVTIAPDIRQGSYPFKGMKLSRADMEWLLATHENGRGPVDWGDESQRERDGLDVRGANLSLVDLSGLPLARLRGGLTLDEWKNATEDQRNNSVVDISMSTFTGTHLEGAILIGVHLKGSMLSGTYLEAGILSYAELEGATLNGAHLRETILIGAQMGSISLDDADMEKVNVSFARLSHASLKKANLRRAIMNGTNLEYANLMGANLEFATLNTAKLKGAKLIETLLGDAILGGAHLEEANLNFADLKRAILMAAHLERATLNGTQLMKAHLNGAHLEEANLSEAQLEGADLSTAQLEGADLRGASLEGANLKNVTIANTKQIGPRIADIQWGTVNLTVVRWSQVKMLGDEFKAHQKEDSGNAKDKNTRISEYEAAVRANRQLAVVLENQGLNEDATRFAHRACSLQRKVYGKRRNYWKWFGSGILAVLAGYGYSMWRILLAYGCIVVAFAAAYFVLGIFYQTHLSFPDAIWISITAFHGRVFSEPFLHPGAFQLWATAIEAIFGLLIEGVFIAMLTQKFFGK